MVYRLRDAVSAVVVASALAFSPISVLAQSSDLIVEKKVFEAPSYKTVAGETIKNVRIGWESAGVLNEEKSNAIPINKTTKYSRVE